MFVVKVETNFVVGAGGEDRCLLMANVKVLVVTGVEVVSVRESAVLVGVIDGVVVRGEVISVVRLRPNIPSRNWCGFPGGWGMRGRDSHLACVSSQCSRGE